MRLLILHIYFLCCLAGVGFAKPPVKKVHAYKQGSIPGIVPRLNDHTQKSERKPSFNYWFYLELGQHDKIEITGLWIGGIQSEYKMEIISHLPVNKIISSGATVNDTVTMVPATRNKVILIYPSATTAKNSHNSNYLEKLIAGHELVIRYAGNGKKYYAVAKKIEILPSDVQV
jgi:hypothetical protein